MVKINKILITGNIVKDIDLKFATSGTAVLKNTVAVRRKIKDKTTGKYESDFIGIIAFGKTAEFIAEKFTKGQGIQVEAHMQSGSYEKDGVKKYTLDAIVENVEFLGSKGQTQNQDTSGSNNFGNMNQDLENRFDGELEIDNTDSDMAFLK